MPEALRYHPDKVLRTPTRQIHQFTPELKKLGARMREVMAQHHGMGLAAIQIGDLRRVISIELAADPENQVPAIPLTVLVNPKISRLTQAKEVAIEGCLSLPGAEVKVARAKAVTVLAQTLEGKAVRLRAKGLLARILQHEIDHLNNVLLVDYEKRPVGKTKKALNSIVWGSTPFTTQFLNTVRQSPEITVSHVVTEPPKPKGRGRELLPTIAHRYAQSLAIPCLEPIFLSDKRFISYLQRLEPDLFLVAAYGRRLPAEILAIPHCGSLNIHPSLLPRYRGPTPIQSAILDGEGETGVTIITMTEEIDGGPILAQSKLSLTGEETYGDLELLLAELGGILAAKVIPGYCAGSLDPIPQDEEGATTTKKFIARDRWLNPLDSPRRNGSKVRAFAPSPGAFVVLDGQPLKVLAAHQEGQRLIFDQVKPAGKRPMSLEDFSRGYRRRLHFQPYRAILDKDQEPVNKSASG